MTDRVGPARGATRGWDGAALVFAMIYPTVLTVTYFVGLGDAPAWLQQSVYGAGKVLQFGFPLGWVVVIHRERFRMGAASRRALLWGAFFGAAVGLAIPLLWTQSALPADVLGPLRAAVEGKLRGFGIQGAWAYLALAAFYSIGHSFLEEYYWRWFVFGRLRAFVGLWAAVTLSSLAFMAHHVVLLGAFLGWRSPLVWVLSVCVAAGGAAWALTYERSGSLVPCWLGHIGADVGIFWVGYQLACVAGG